MTKGSAAASRNYRVICAALQQRGCVWACVFEENAARFSTAQTPLAEPRCNAAVPRTKWQGRGAIRAIHRFAAKSWLRFRHVAASARLGSTQTSAYQNNRSRSPGPRPSASRGSVTTAQASARSFCGEAPRRSAFSRLGFGPPISCWTRPLGSGNGSCRQKSTVSSLPFQGYHGVTGRSDGIKLHCRESGQNGIGSPERGDREVPALEVDPRASDVHRGGSHGA